MAGNGGRDSSGFKTVNREMTSVRNRTIDKASRYALSSVLPNYAVENDTYDTEERDHVLRGYSTLSEEWRKRVVSLRSAGWSALENKRASYARNCPESGVWLDRGSMKPCGLRQVCPWCWVRYYVHETFFRLKYALWRTLDDPQAPPFQFDIYDCVTWENWPYHLATSKLYDRVVSLRSETLKREVPGNLGAFQFFTISPPDTRTQHPSWEICQRLLILVNVGEEGPPDIPQACHPPQGVRTSRRVKLTSARDEQGLTQTQLAAPIGRVALYPAQLLRGPRDLTAELLEYKGKYRKTSEQGKRKSATGFRMGGYYGCLRNASHRRRELALQPAYRPDMEG